VVSSGRHAPGAPGRRRGSGRRRNHGRGGLCGRRGASETSAGGRTETAGVFLLGSLALSPQTSLSAALRADGWRHRHGHVTTRQIAADTAVTTASFPDRSDGALSPQRQNLGSTRSHGIEVEASTRPTTRLALGVAYQWVEATVRSHPADPSLEGRALPQVPQHQGSFHVRLTLPHRILVSLQGRMAGPQFDDDRNALELGRYFALDALLSFPIRSRLELYAAVENVTGTRYEVSRTPVTTYGPPRQARIGLRVLSGSRGAL
jgi:outer membrane cobalamin receptor